MSYSIRLFELFESTCGPLSRRLLFDVTGKYELGGSELAANSKQIAGRLRSAGLSAGKVVVVKGMPPARFVQVVLGVWACDAIPLPVPGQIAPTELEALCREFSPAAIVSAEPLEVVRGVEAGPSLALPPETAVLKLTSGTTGAPRGIAVTSGQLLADVDHIVGAMEVGPEDVNIAAIPMSHSYGMDSLLMPLVLQGSALAIVPPPLNHHLGRALSLHEPTVFPGVPYLFEMLVEGEDPDVQLAGLRTCLSAGAPLRPSTAAAFRERFGLPVRSFYGTSETGGICFDASPEGDAAIRAPGCVGTPLPGVSLELEGDERRVVVRGDNVASGYVGRAMEGDEGARFRDGAFLTTDTAILGAAGGPGELILTGRVGSLVNVSGRKVNPREVEAALQKLEGVRDCAVIGVADDRRGESLVACLVRDKLLGREEVLRHLRGQLAAYKLPRRIVFVERVPRNERGKVDARGLQQAIGRIESNSAQADRDYRSAP